MPGETGDKHRISSQSAPSSNVAAVATRVVSNFLFANLGMFALLPVLPVWLGRVTDGDDAWFVGFALFVFAFCVRGASLFFAGLLHRTPVRLAMSGGLMVAAVSFAVMTLVDRPVGILLLLILAGAGISANSLMARVYIAMSLPSSPDRNTVFAALQIAVNISAALGPVAANLLFSDQGGATVLLAVAAAYGLAAVVVALSTPKGMVPGDGDVRPPLRFQIIKDMADDNGIRRISVVTIVGTFLYAQLFSALVLHVATLTDSALLRASFFTTNALVIVIAQVPVAMLTKRLLNRGTSPLALLVVGIAGFGVAFLLLGWVGAMLAGTLLAVVMFSLAETVFTPIVNTAFGELPGDRPLVEVFNMRQVAVTIGESSGSFAGGALFLLAASRGATQFYWYALAGSAVLTVVAFRTAFAKPAASSAA